MTESKERPGEKNQARGRNGNRFEKSAPDPIVTETIRKIEDQLNDTLEPAMANGLNSFQRKQIDRYFTRIGGYQVKTIRENDESVFLKIYPVGKIKHLAETKAREVLMTGESQCLPPMDSFQRFLVHEYIKTRRGLRTESAGEGNNRFVYIFPVYGRTPRKIKRKLTR